MFATASVVGGYASGMLVRHADGRPIKVEGNPAHPASLGATRRDRARQRSWASMIPTAAAGIARDGEPQSWSEPADGAGGAACALG